MDTNWKIDDPNKINQIMNTPEIGILALCSSLRGKVYLG